MTARFTTLQKLAEKIGIGIEVEHFSTSNPPYSIGYMARRVEVDIGLSLIHLRSIPVFFIICQYA